MRAAGVAGPVLLGEDVGEHAEALAAGPVLTHQLGLQERGPAPLQRLHAAHIRLRERGREREREGGREREREGAIEIDIYYSLE